jgi:hypothetical protein
VALPCPVSAIARFPPVVVTVIMIGAPVDISTTNNKFSTSQDYRDQLLSAIELFAALVIT